MPDTSKAPFSKALQRQHPNDPQVTPRTAMSLPLPKQITSHHSNCQDQAPLKNPPSVEPAESYINKQCLTRTGTNSGNHLPPLPRGGGETTFKLSPNADIMDDNRLSHPTTLTFCLCSESTSTLSRILCGCNKILRPYKKGNKSSAGNGTFCVIYRRGQLKKSPSIEQKNVSTAVEHELFFFFQRWEKKG